MRQDAPLPLPLLHTLPLSLSFPPSLLFRLLLLAVCVFANTLESFAILIGDGSVLKMDLNYIVSHTRHKDVSKFAHSKGCQK